MRAGHDLCIWTKWGPTPLKDDPKDGSIKRLWHCSILEIECWHLYEPPQFQLPMCTLVSWMVLLNLPHLPMCVGFISNLWCHGSWVEGTRFPLLSVTLWHGGWPSGCRECGGVLCGGTISMVSSERDSIVGGMMSCRWAIARARRKQTMLVTIEESGIFFSLFIANRLSSWLDVDY